jgi:hypothetical protein
MYVGEGPAMRVNWQLVAVVGAVLILMILLATALHYGILYRLPGRGGLGMH